MGLWDFGLFFIDSVGVSLAGCFVLYCTVLY